MTDLYSMRYAAIHILYTANYSRWKNFVVVELNWNSLESTHSCMVVVCCLAKPYYTGDYHYFTGKVSGLLINPWKPQNFSTSNDLQYMHMVYDRWLDYCTLLAVDVDSTHTLPYSELWLKYSRIAIKLMNLENNACRGNSV